jgi:hypothetical protein
MQYADTVYDDYMRLQDEEIRELQDQMNVNTCDDNFDTWLNSGEVEYTETIDEDEFFARYCDDVEDF